MASTEKQAQANRQNTRHSTGPRTPEGKSRSAANRTTRALTGRDAALPPPVSTTSSLTWRMEPQTETEARQVELIAHPYWWRLVYAELVEARLRGANGVV